MTTRDLVYIALFAAISAATAIFPPITLPFGVPIVVQSIAPLLAGSIIGAWRGALSIVLFIALVAIGLPLLSGGRGGIAHLLAPAGGFVFSWIIVAAVVGWLIQRRHGNAGLVYRIASNLFGALVISYPIGIVWLSYSTGITLQAAAFAACAFIGGDIVKVIVASVVSRAVQRAYPIIT